MIWAIPLEQTMNCSQFPGLGKQPSWPLQFSGWDVVDGLVVGTIDGLVVGTIDDLVVGFVEGLVVGFVDGLDGAVVPPSFLTASIFTLGISSWLFGFS